jgi:predicted regulator of Ras-like GTPase activity (Roadblock/LC7/MglB family)
MNRVDTGMKTGRVSFTWGELSQWLDGGSVPASPNKDMLLELPLKVIIPLFMAQRQAGAAQKKVSIGENIPNLFAGLTVAPVQAPVAEPPAPGPESESEPITAIAPDPVTAVTVPAVPPPAAAPASVLGEIFGQPAKKDWSPQEIAEKLKTLPGISAALIAMSDGLLVAGDLPAPLKSDTLAAFLPQMFSRMNHYSTETQLGMISTLTIQTDQNQCAIYKAGTLLLAVLNKPGELLPESVLQKVVGELAKRTS